MKSDAERIVRVETKMEDMNSKISDIQSDVKEIKNVLSMQPSLREEINQLRQEIEAMKHRQGTRLWVERAIAGAGFPLLTMLILNYLDKLR